jgi:hypothetical protein
MILPREKGAPYNITSYLVEPVHVLTRAKLMISAQDSASGGKYCRRTPRTWQAERTSPERVVPTPRFHAKDARQSRCARVFVFGGTNRLAPLDAELVMREVTCADL